MLLELCSSSMEEELRRKKKGRWEARTRASSLSSSPGAPYKERAQGLCLYARVSLCSSPLVILISREPRDNEWTRRHIALYKHLYSSTCLRHLREMPSLPLSSSCCPQNLHVLFLSSPEDICDDPVKDVPDVYGE